MSVLSKIFLATIVAAAATTAGSPAASAEPAPVVAAVGDIACSPSRPQTADSCRHAPVANAISGINPSSVWLLGDIQYSRGRLGAFQESFDPAFGRFRPIWRPVIGNHEYGTPGASGYFDYFGAAAGNRARGYYSFDIGEWHVVALNSNCLIVACHAKSEQAKWLRRDLEKNRRKCTAAMWHHPLFSSGKTHGNNPSTRAFWRILRASGAELVLSGHDHDFEVFKKQDSLGRRAPLDGMQQFVVGTGGKSAYAFGPRPANSLVRRTWVYGFLELQLKPESYDWRFIDERGAALHRGSGRCR